MIQFFATSTTSVTRIMFDCTLRFPSDSSPTTSYSNPGAQGEQMYAWVFWYDKKSFKSNNNVLVCYSYHNTLVCSETQAMVKQQNSIVGRHIRVCKIVHIILTIKNYVLEYVCTTLQRVTLHVCIIWYLLYIWYFVSLKKATWCMMQQVVLEGLVACVGFTSL